MGGRNGRSLKGACVAVALGLAFPAAAGPEQMPVAFDVRIAHEPTADLVREALRQRLESPKCQAIFSDFVDTSGHPLRERLEGLGQTPQGYLAQVLFYDGTSQPRCQAKGVLAVTAAGSPVVFVCPDAIREGYHRQPLYVEATLIHEALHTLGLGENPPTSREITSRVVSRCHR